MDKTDLYYKSILEKLLNWENLSWFDDELNQFNVGMSNYSLDARNQVADDVQKTSFILGMPGVGKTTLLLEHLNRAAKNTALFDEKQNSFEKAIEFWEGVSGSVSTNNVNSSLKQLNRQRKKTGQAIVELEYLIEQAISPDELAQICFELDVAFEDLGITKDYRESNPLLLLKNLKHSIDLLWKNAIRRYKRLKGGSKCITCSVQTLSRFTRAIKGALLHTLELKFNDPSPARLFTILNFNSNGGPPRLAAPLNNLEFLYQRQGVAALGAVVYG